MYLLMGLGIGILKHLKECRLIIFYLKYQWRDPQLILHQQEIQRLFTDSPSYSLQRSQAVHGRIIRHIMYLIDDVISAIFLSLTLNRSKGEIFNI